MDAHAFSPDDDFLLFCAFAMVATPAMAKRSKSHSKASAKTEQVASSSKKTKKSKKRAVAAPVLGEAQGSPAPAGPLGHRGGL
jgi:hypothetical protein